MYARIIKVEAFNCSFTLDQILRFPCRNVRKSVRSKGQELHILDGQPQLIFQGLDVLIRWEV